MDSAQRFRALRFMHLCNQVAMIGQHSGKLARGEIQQEREHALTAPRKPGMHDGNDQFDMSHPLTAHPAPGNLDAADLTDKPREAPAPILSARASPVLERTKDPLTQEAAWHWLVGPVVDRLRSCDLAPTPGTDLFWRGQANAQSLQVVHIVHPASPYACVCGSAWAASLLSPSGAASSAGVSFSPGSCDPREGKKGSPNRSRCWI